MIDLRKAYKMFVAKAEKKKHFEDPGINGSIILKCSSV
jgi:hypothetical protein